MIWLLSIKEVDMDFLKAWRSCKTGSLVRLCHHMENILANNDQCLILTSIVTTKIRRLQHFCDQYKRDWFNYVPRMWRWLRKHGYTPLSLVINNHHKMCENLIIHTLSEMKCKNPVLNHLCMTRSLNANYCSSRWSCVRGESYACAFNSENTTVLTILFNPFPNRLLLQHNLLAFIHELMWIQGFSC